MKYLLAILLLASSFAFAAPDVVTDPLAPGVTDCGVFVDSQPKAVVPVTAVPGGNICQFDVSDVSNGAHSVKMTAIKNDPVWGVLESPESLPLDFVRPGPPSVPGGVRLQP